MIQAPAVAFDDIVLLEDDPRFAREVKKLLEARGRTVHWVQKPREALEYHAQGAMYFILDVMIGNENEAGLQILDSIKREAPEKFIAIFSGLRGNERKAVGCDIFWEKSPEETASQVDKVYLLMCATEADRDPDHQAFLCLMKDEGWVQAHHGEYVGIVDAMPVAFDRDRKELLKKLDKYPADVAKYYNVVEKSPRTVCVLTPFPRK
jgi:CheY-like chemotaxis protein